MDFTGWGACPAAFEGVRLGASTAAPSASRLGSSLAGVPNGVVFNFSGRCSGPTAENCYRDDAVHEFGHVLGFTHEHLRVDTDPSCTEPQIGTSPIYHLTDYDPDSVMNYCNDGFNTQLSPLDVLGVRRAYGPWSQEEALAPTVVIWGYVNVLEYHLIGTSDETVHLEPFGIEAGDPRRVETIICKDDRIRVDVELDMLVKPDEMIVEFTQHLAEGQGCGSAPTMASRNSSASLFVLNQSMPIGSPFYIKSSKTAATMALKVMLVFPSEPTAAVAAFCGECVLDANNSVFADPPPSEPGPSIEAAEATCVACKDDSPKIEDSVATPLPTAKPPSKIDSGVR